MDILVSTLNAVAALRNNLFLRNRFILFQSVGNRDLIVVQDLVMLVTAAVLVVNFVVDLSYRLLDPRISAR